MGDVRPIVISTQPNSAGRQMARDQGANSISRRSFCRPSVAVLMAARLRKHLRSSVGSKRWALGRLTCARWPS